MISNCSKQLSALKTWIYHFIVSWLACVRCFSAPEMFIQHHPRAWTYNLWTLRLGRDLTELPAEWETSWLHWLLRPADRLRVKTKGKPKLHFLVLVQTGINLNFKRSKKNNKKNLLRHLFILKLLFVLKSGSFNTSEHSHRGYRRRLQTP